MNVTLALDDEQSRKVCFDHLVNHLIIMKQYLDIDEFKHYKFVLSKVGTLVELAEAERNFNRGWPQDLVWEDLD